ncbi:MAG TPA: pitrilysin family protein [Candidatus Eisenbacteria bacterium]|jgi:zinc protease
MNDRAGQTRPASPRPRPAASLAGALALTLALPAWSGAALDPRFDPSKLTPPPLHAIREVKPQRKVMGNGLVLYLLADHSLPVVRGEAYIRASSLWDPPEKVGLAGLTGEVMRTGGSAARSGDWIDDRLAAIGASLETYIGEDYASASFRCLSENTAEVVGLLAEVVRRPAFPEDKIELAKVGLRRQIAGRNDELLSVFQHVAMLAIYGRESPYARIPEYATVEAITRADCVKMHRQCFVPNRTILVIYGDFEPEAISRLVASGFRDWKRDDAAPPALPAPPARGKARVVFAPKEDVTQSAVVLAQLGFKADSPDYADMEVLERALGSSWQSRLFNKVRTQRGLAYATGATSGAAFMRPGRFYAYSLTRNDSVMAALDLVREEVVRVTREPVTAQELATAREGVQNSFVFNFEQPSAVAFRAGYYELAGYPQDFLQRYQKAVESVTPASMLAAAQRQIEPGKLITVIVGKEKEFDRPLESIGLPVERVDIGIPPPPSKAPAGAATPEALARGKQWLQRAAERAGGPAAWAAIKSWSEDVKVNLSMQGQSISLEGSLSWMLPDRRFVVQKTPMGDVIQGFDGSAGWAKAMGRIQDDPTGARKIKEEYERSLFHLFAHPEALELQALAEPRTIDGASYSAAYVKSESVRDWTLLFDAEGRLAGMEYAGEGPQGPGKQTKMLGDWRAVGAIQYPHSTRVTLDGKPLMEATVTQARANPDLAADLFKKPAE